MNIWFVCSGLLFEKKREEKIFYSKVNFEDQVSGADVVAVLVRREKKKKEAKFDDSMHE
jgi:hypothetical protein